MSSKYINELSSTGTCQSNSDFIIDDIRGTLRISYSDLASQIDTRLTSTYVRNIVTTQNQTQENPLVDKNFVNSSIATNTATFQGTYGSLQELSETNADNNDYGFVSSVVQTGLNRFDRYKYNGDLSTWNYEYTLNNSSFTSEQWNAINSKISEDTKVTHTANTAIGSDAKPVYIGSNGIPVETSCSFCSEQYVDEALRNVFSMIYPVGSIYITVSTATTCPLASVIGTWDKITAGRCLWSTDDISEVGQELSGILPAHTHNYTSYDTSVNTQDGSTNNRLKGTKTRTTTTMSLSSTVNNVIIGDTLRPPSIGVIMWKRVS